MANQPTLISRYPNRRFYARSTSKYVSLPEIEAMICAGDTVRIEDKQTGADITRMVLAQLIIDRQPEKISLFPTDMLHFIVRSNDMMTDFLRDYFRQSLTYLNFLQKHGSTAQNLVNPVHWVKAWLDGIRSGQGDLPTSEMNDEQLPEAGISPQQDLAPDPQDPNLGLQQRILELEARIQQLETREASIADNVS